ncbi:hypothetical protein V8D89_003823 [Ganoderma adspersum]
MPPVYSSEGASNQTPRRHSSLPSITLPDTDSRINLPPPPPYHPNPTRRGVPNVRTPVSSTPPLVSPGYRPVDQGDLEAANFSGRPGPLSPAHVLINELVFFVAIVILAVTVMLFYLLHLDERGVPNPAGFFVVLSSAASIASALVTIHRLEKGIPNNGRATWPTTMAIGVPLMFLTCAILAFITFLVGLNFSSL